MLALYPRWAAVALVYFTIARIVLGKRKMREAGTIASLTTWIVFTILMLSFTGQQDTFYALVMTMFLIGRHKKNLAALLSAPAAGIADQTPAAEAMDNREAAGSQLGSAEKTFRNR